jgi:hypothetical protein
MLVSCFKLVLNKELYAVSCKGSSEKNQEENNGKQKSLENEK